MSKTLFAWGLVAVALTIIGFPAGVSSQPVNLGGEHIGAEQRIYNLQIFGFSVTQKTIIEPVMPGIHIDIGLVVFAFLINLVFAVAFCVAMLPALTKKKK